MSRFVPSPRWTRDGHLADDGPARTGAITGRDRPQETEGPNLRRAVSAAYYALFHLLTDAAVRRMTSSQRQHLALRQLLGRAFTHGDMSRVSKQFANGHGGLPDHLRAVLPDPAKFPVALQSVAGTLVELQAARHRADYDLGYRFTRAGSLAAIARAEEAVTLWETACSTEAARVYLIALLLGDRLKAR